MSDTQETTNHVEQPVRLTRAIDRWFEARRQVHDTAVAALPAAIRTMLPDAATADIDPDTDEDGDWRWEIAGVHDQDGNLLFASGIPRDDNLADFMNEIEYEIANYAAATHIGEQWPIRLDLNTGEISYRDDQSSDARPGPSQRGKQHERSYR